MTSYLIMTSFAYQVKWVALTVLRTRIFRKLHINLLWHRASCSWSLSLTFISVYDALQYNSPYFFLPTPHRRSHNKVDSA